MRLREEDVETVKTQRYVENRSTFRGRTTQDSTLQGTDMRFGLHRAPHTTLTKTILPLGQYVYLHTERSQYFLGRLRLKALGSDSSKWVGTTFDAEVVQHPITVGFSIIARFIRKRDQAEEQGIA